ncbi:hypothetical protein APHAL10511_004531 [Amanita phalloides]|nr:hypothetical protein APHAL10511_004531 [Amanita phalloides]
MLLQNGTRNKLAVLVHPWSWLGGQMHVPVLGMLTKSLGNKGFHTVRFNSRGVGSSTGRATFTGMEEGKDLEAVVQWAISRVTDVERLVLIGYSHGGLIVSLHPILTHIKTSHVLLSYPLSPRGWITMFHGSAYQNKLEMLVRDERSDVLVIHGDADEFTSKNKYGEWSGQLGGGRVVEIAGGTHFWLGSAGEEMQQFVLALSSFLYFQMPLPDERPRQSVANLIGRFENQNKRPPLRSPTVVSQNTGDSLDHEPKEKREWPPRSISERIASLESSTPRPRPTLPPSQSVPQPSTPPMILEPIAPPADDPIPVIETKSTVENQADDDKVAVPVAVPPPVPSPSPPRSPPTTSKQTVIKGSPSKSVTRTTNKSTTARHSSGAPIIPPLKPQHTGLSTASTASTRKLATSPIPTKSPIRPASAAAARPKTPSSGLHAPTAASLARSRNAPAASTSTIPVKKSTFTASASDRLNKHTAASLLRTRIPAPPAAHSSRPNTRSVATPAKVTIKPKAASSLPRKSSPVKRPATAADTDIDTGAPTASHNVQSEAVDHNEPINGHSPKGHVEDASPSEQAAEQVKEHTESDVHEVMKVNAEKGADVHPESDVDAANEGTPTEVEPAHSVSIVEASQNFEQDFKIDQDDDIEFMVKILESVTIPVRPVSIATIPDEVHEIPDEE